MMGLPPNYKVISDIKTLTIMTKLSRVGFIYDEYISIYTNGEGKVMKKISILLIALMVISVGFLSGCEESSTYIDKSDYKVDVSVIEHYVFDMEVDGYKYVVVDFEVRNIGREEVCVYRYQFTLESVTYKLSWDYEYFYPEFGITNSSEFEGGCLQPNEDIRGYLVYYIDWDLYALKLHFEDLCNNIDETFVAEG